MEQNATEYIKELERKVEILTRLVEVNTVLNGALLSANPRLEALLGYIMDAAADITGTESASILLWKNSTQELFFASTKTDNEQARQLIGKPVPLDSIAGTIFSERRIIRVDDAMNDSRIYKKVDDDLQFVTRSLLGVPMISKQKVIGVLEVVNKKQLPWTKEDEDNLMILAEEAAMVIEVAQLVLEIKKANKELNEVDKLKSDFIAIASHELRTPLGVILGYVSFLQDETVNSEVAEFANKAMESALQLRGIIEDMVNLRYLKQSASEMMFENVTVTSLLHDIKQEATALMGAKQQKLIVNMPEEEVIVYADSSRIHMALSNIINNAVRFTKQGGVIHINCKVNKRPHEIWISIKDNGIGLEKHQIAKIFEEFYQVEDHMTRHNGGLGIGLSIAQALVKAHNGRIWADSEGLGHGASFTIALPIVETEAE